MNLIFFAFFSGFLFASSEEKQLPSVYLRPKPKARAGGADASGAPVYSVTSN